MRIARLLLAVVLAFALATPALARVAAIETTAPLADHSEESIKAALKLAVSTAVRGAVAMGFQWVQVKQAVVFADVVSVQILASDSDPPGEADGAVPAPEPEPEADEATGLARPARIDI